MASPPASMSPTAEPSSDGLDGLDGLDLNYTAVDHVSAEDHPAGDCAVDPDFPNYFVCGDRNEIHSPFPTCEAGFVPLFAKKLQDVYTVCCNATDYARGTVFDNGGFGCCATTYQVGCQHAHSVVSCVSDLTHNITEEFEHDVKVCKGEVDRNLNQMLKGFGWMVLLWVLCISGFWGL